MIRRILAHFRWRRVMRSFAKQIQEARSKHKPIRHIEKARREFTLACLRGAMK